MKVLSFTTLYPNAAMPQHGVFVENRLKRLATRPGIDLKVMAPVPYFFDRSNAFGTHLSGEPLPGEETRFGIPVSHPRYPLIPKIGMGVAPRLLEMWCRPALRKWISVHGRPDV
ncbi:MAG: glycosyltransferase family 4 protein, partial [Alphaproteobacteria bacterium]|nr:glycosyltransferase family 4 protein [Alphaproteobacteria bacterium]